MPDSPFVTHEHDTIPLGRNVLPIPECKVNSTLQDGKVIKAVDVHILSCESVWLRCQQEAEQWISDCDQLIISNPALVNARINAAYAYLWLQDPRFQWAGLAAFASKQVGCGLLHAADTLKKAEIELQKPSKGFGQYLSSGIVDEGVAYGAKYMMRQLALANRALFLDIYPVHRFYTLRGIDGVRKCLGERKNIANKVRWPEELKNKLPFGLLSTEMRKGFEAIEQNNLITSVQELARHEQINVLQKVLYDDSQTRIALEGNQLVWVTGMPSGYYQEVQLTLSAQCKPKPTLTTWFKRSLAVHLYNKDDRMEFVYRAADDFDKLLRTQRREVEQSIREIYHGRGVR